MAGFKELWVRGSARSIEDCSPNMPSGATKALILVILDTGMPFPVFPAMAWDGRSDSWF